MRKEQRNILTVNASEDGRYCDGSDVEFLMYDMGSDELISLGGASAQWFRNRRIDSTYTNVRRVSGRASCSESRG